MKKKFYLNLTENSRNELNTFSIELLKKLPTFILTDWVCTKDGLSKPHFEGRCNFCTQKRLSNILYFLKGAFGKDKLGLLQQNHRSSLQEKKNIIKNNIITF